MKFRSELIISPSTVRISHTDRILLVGSCFSENISKKLSYCKIPCLSNPSGILYNPVSIADALQGYADKKVIAEEDLFLLNEQFHSWHHHSLLSEMNRSVAIEKINSATAEAHIFLATATVLIITLGTATVSVLSSLAAGKEGSIVANNHKAPASWFEKKLQSTTEIKKALQDVLVTLEKVNPSLKIIFTVSPVRHSKDGLVENNRSKANLITAVHDLVDLKKQVSYFPAYELVIDDLRDYRFYTEDLVHPNTMAVDYVWQKFSETYFSADTIAINTKISELQTAMQHRPFAASSEGYKKFKENFLAKTKTLAAENKGLYLSDLLGYFSS